MKVAILGNMNNNGFAIMRYMRDLGVDAHLLLYQNDGVGSLSHFRPEDDTWDIERWAPYIHRTPLVNSLYAGLSGPANIFNFLQALLCFVRRDENPRLHWASPKKIRNALKGFDAYIGSGIAPALFLKAGMRLDEYYPYATGVEHLGTVELNSRLPRMSRLKRAVSLRAVDKQRQGLRAVGCIFNGEFSLTKKILDREDIPFKPLLIPMVYLEPPGDAAHYSENLSKTLAAIGGRKYFLAVSRQLWKKPAYMTDADWWRETKNSDWLLRAFAELCKKRSGHGRMFVLASYGPDLEHSKSLCRELGIENQVYWMPKLARKELGVIARGACAIAGEFKNPKEMIWGGAGWETLAASKPLIHSFKFAAERYETLYGTPCPPVLAVAEQCDVLTYLMRLVDDPAYGEAIAEEAGKWFQRHQGIGLAKKWLEFISAVCR